MKDIRIYEADKYAEPRYKKVVNHIYQTVGTSLGGVQYVTSLSFVQEPDLEEGEIPQDVSQYPLEDVLDAFCVAVEDFYEEENAESQEVCYLKLSGKN